MTLRQQVRGFLADQLAAGAFTPACDSWLSGWDEAFSRALSEQGWLGMTVPTEYGGGGRTPSERYVVVEELLAAGAPVAAHWIADRQVAPTLVRFGTELQRQRFLPEICAGRALFAIGMSEPEAGSDLAGLQTRAERVEGGWSVSGRKVWTSGAHRADHSIMLVRTGSERHAGLTQLLVDLHADGVHVSPIVSMSGEHHFNEVLLEQVAVPDAMVVGEVGRGWAQATAELGYERSGPERFCSTVPLLRAVAPALDPATLGGLLARLATLRAMSLQVARRMDAGEDPGVAAALVKDLGTRFESELVETVRSQTCAVADPAGTTVERLLAQAVVHAPGFTLRGGTNEVLRGVVAHDLGLR